MAVKAYGSEGLPQRTEFFALSGRDEGEPGRLQESERTGKAAGERAHQESAAGKRIEKAPRKEHIYV